MIGEAGYLPIVTQYVTAHSPTFSLICAPPGFMLGFKLYTNFVPEMSPQADQDAAEDVDGMLVRGDDHSWDGSHLVAPTRLMTACCQRPTAVGSFL